MQYMSLVTGLELSNSQQFEIACSRENPEGFPSDLCINGLLKRGRYCQAPPRGGRKKSTRPRRRTGRRGSRNSEDNTEPQLTGRAKIRGVTASECRTGQRGGTTPRRTRRVTGNRRTRGEIHPAVNVNMPTAPAAVVAAPGKKTLLVVLAVITFATVNAPGPVDNPLAFARCRWSRHPCLTLWRW